MLSTSSRRQGAPAEVTTGCCVTVGVGTVSAVSGGCTGVVTPPVEEHLEPWSVFQHG